MTPAEESAKRKRVWRLVFVWARGVLFTLLILSGLGMAAIALMIKNYERGLPATQELKKYQPPQVTRILARDGSLLGEDFVERRTVVELDSIPAHVKLAFLAAEDASFYEHEGLDYPGMLRAIWKNLRAQSSRQGASTITQQVVKNVLLTQDRTYERKIKEVILARRIEAELSKDEILELYLNHIYFGHGRYGVEEAARYYFGRGIHDLTLGEAAILASIPKGPSIYEPRAHLENALKRRVYVLDQMVDKSFAKQEIAEEAKNAPVILAPEPEHTAELAPEAMAEVRRTLREVAGDGALRGGYTITTTIDPKLQAEARKAVRDGLDGFDKRQKLVAPLKKPKKMPALFEGDPLKQKELVYWAEVTGADDAKNELLIRVGSAKGKVSLSHSERYNPQKLSASKFADVGAPVRVSMITSDTKAKDALPSFRLELGPQAAMVAIDVRTREILAMAGSYEGARGGLDRATQAHRQPGSSFKPFTYAQAIRTKKFTPASLIPTKVGEGEKYKPKNYDPNSGGEPKRMREVLSKSVNASAAFLVQQVGPSSVAQLANELGIESKLGATPSIALGAYEVTPRELGNAYASLAAGGLFSEAHLISKIVGPDGREISLPVKAEPKRVLSEAEAYVTTDLLKSVISDGTGKGALVLKRPIAGKTGTSNEVRDAWFAGYSTDIACAVWTGYDDRIPLGAGESGGATSLPIFVSFMRAAHQGTPATDFPVPAGVVRVSIDPKTGLLATPEQEDAVSEVFLAGTEPKETAELPPSSDGGQVAEAPAPKPEAGKSASPVPVDEAPPL
jgi:penicillin-binding protein 1A